MNKLEVAVNDTIKWLVASQEVSKQEYEEKQKELEAIAKYASFFLRIWSCYSRSCFSPIMQRLYGSAGGVPGGPRGFPGGLAGSPGGSLFDPSVEVD